MIGADTLVMAALFFAVAALYSSVGHAGASGYLAVMAMFSVVPEVMKPTALALNILVASVAAVKFYRAGLFDWKLFWPFAVTSVPAAFAGGAVTLPAEQYRVVVGVVLLFAAGWMFWSARRRADGTTTRPPLAAALLWGLGLGFISGLTGVGGGIFLSPLLLVMRWSTVRTTSAVAAVFILVNSIAGLLGHAAGIANLHPGVGVWALAVLAGGWIGSRYGSGRLPAPVLRQLLSLVLLIAAVKLMAS